MQNPNLTDEQKDVLFNEATEAPYTGKWLYNEADGSYFCANCGAVLFDSTHKFEAHCGWPSFDRAVPGSVKLTDDDSFGMQRVAVTCATCGGHLGHVFPDGPRETTGERYCINSLSLDFQPKQ